jgi:hypothetical protein
MSTDTNTSTLMNISETSPFYKGECSLKCDYSFLYNLSTCRAYHQENSISFSYDSNTNGSAQVSYNGIEYNVWFVELITPSIHLFNGQQTSAELFIIHTPLVAGPSLYVCIPIVGSTGIDIVMSPATQLVSEMISQSIELIPKDGEETTLNLQGYSLEHIVPKQPFYSYTDISNNATYVVYGAKSGVTVSDKLIKRLSEILSPSNDTTQNGLPFFMNKKGPTNLSLQNLSDEIYIDCQPTGSSTEQTNITTIKNTNNNSIMFFIYVIFFLLVLFSIYMLFAYITHSDKKSISLNNIKNPFT